MNEKEIQNKSQENESETFSWQEIQRSTFTNWCNTVLKDCNVQIKNLYDDFTDGTILIQMYQILSGKSVGKYNQKPKILQHIMENLDIVMRNFKKDGLILVNIGIFK